jgi:hypothetical protein
MRKTILTALFGALALVLAASAVHASEKSISIEYAGTGYDTTVDNGGDGWPVNLSTAEAKGSFGARRLEISTEFYAHPMDCADGYAVEMALIYSASVVTFSANDQLFAFSDSGWMCVHPATGHYYGEAYGVYGGGTGRFEGASGEWMTAFQGYNLEPPGLIPVGFRSINGTVSGTVILP